MLPINSETARGALTLVPVSSSVGGVGRKPPTGERNSPPVPTTGGFFAPLVTPPQRATLDLALDAADPADNPGERRPIPLSGGAMRAVGLSKIEPLRTAITNMFKI
jgi:hypothetical protein